MVGDSSLADAVRSELGRDPWLARDAQIGVSAKDGAITLTGYVLSHEQEAAAVRAAQRVAGVLAVADDINVLNGPNAVADSEIAARIARARAAALIPDALSAEVRNGRVTLRGEVDGVPQRSEAERAVRRLAGVRNVTSYVTTRERAVRADPGFERGLDELRARHADVDRR
jgi:osmotically-inducible protein OsmY